MRFSLFTLNQENGSTDRIEQLTRTLAQGAYTHPDDIDIPAQTKLDVQLREKPVELNNRTLAQKYANTSSNRAAANSAYRGHAYQFRNT